MSPQITKTEDYILIEPSEADYWEILETVGKLLQMPEYTENNVIWMFREGPLRTTYADLFKLKDFIKQYYPEKAKPYRKIAIVVETGLYIAMAKEYTKTKNSLPVQYEVFSDLKSAEDWIKE